MFGIKENGKWKRGVVFIKEIVPKPALTFVANTIYKEHYQTMRMSHTWKEEGDSRIVRYSWSLDSKEHSFAVKAALKPTVIEKGSKAEFITEHYWGYTRAGNNSSFEYEVTHPRWEGYEVVEHKVEVDFKAVYGNDFAELTNPEPTSVMLAEGSEITENKRTIYKYGIHSSYKICDQRGWSDHRKKIKYYFEKPKGCLYLQPMSCVNNLAL